MKKLLPNSLLRTLLLIAAFFQFTTISAYDFEVDGILYRITSNNTVSVNGNNLIDDGLIEDNLFEPIIIEIPNQITYNYVDYTVTAIEDNAFYCNNRFYSEYTSIGLILDITLPETITSIGSNAFGGEGFDLINIICFANTPPEINGNLNSHSVVNLFVNEDAYSLYDDINNQNQLFSSIRITNGERSAIPSNEVEYLHYPDDLSQFNESSNNPCYGFIIRFNKKEKRNILTRMFGLSRMGIYFGEPNYWTNSNYICHEHSSPDPSSYIPQFFIQSYIIDDGKSPNYNDNGLDEGFFTKFDMSFDFKESNVAYNIINPNEIKVTYSKYYDENGIWGGQKRSIITHNGYYDKGIYYIFYSGDIIIPSTATHHDYFDDTYTTYLVTSIGRCAFSLKDFEFDEDNITIDCLTSVTMPASITAVGEYAFGDCPNLSFIKCRGAVPPSAYDNCFDEEVYQNTTLYVPIDAVDAYRNAPGWKNFLNIVGHYSFDYDFVADGIFYAIVDDNVVVTQGEDAYQGVVNIPTNVTYEGVTYNVIGIADNTFTDAALVSLILPVSIENIGEGAFRGCHIGTLVITGDGAWTAGAIDCEVDGLYVMSGVTGIQGLLVNPETTVYSYSTVPPTCDEQTYTGYDAALHVPASALAAYFTAPYWNYFINITSDAVEPTDVTINNHSVSVLVGNQLTLTATPTPANATPNECIWTSSDENIATVEDGVITAVHVGECDIKAYLLDKMAVCHVTVTEIAPTEITISPEFAKLEIGSQVTLTATVMPEDATDKTVIWETTNSDVATVDSDGNVTAVGQGECFITATCRDNQATCHIIVVDHFVFITLDEHSVRMMPNHMAILTPSVMPEGTDLVVTSSNPAVAAARMANGKIQVVGITEGRTVIKVNSTDGYAEVDSCLVRVYTLRGDVNSDGFVNIGDVTALIGYVLSGNAEGVNLENADANNDGGINIGDVTRLIGAILSGEELDPKEEPIEGAETFTVNGVTFTMMPVEGGTFTMGATPEQGTSDPWNDERPTHEVTLSAFMIGQTEVTQALWQAVMGSNPSEFSDNPNRPVEMVSWDDCQAFIAQLNQLTGRTFRLPTEAEWEYAARGGKQSQGYKYAGGDDVNEVAWWDTNAGDGVGPDSPDYGTHQVCTKKANELGLFDMSGNVWEWCQDWYGSYSSDAQTNPAGPATGSNRVYRGGSWFNYARNCRVSSRYHWTMNGANYIGLRLAL